MPKVKVGDINMYYEVHGEGEPLVMINGAGATVEVIPVDSDVLARISVGSLRQQWCRPE